MVLFHGSSYDHFLVARMIWQSSEQDYYHRQDLFYGRKITIIKILTITTRFQRFALVPLDTDELTKKL